MNENCNPGNAIPPCIRDDGKCASITRSEYFTQSSILRNFTKGISCEHWQTVKLFYLFLSFPFFTFLSLTVFLFLSFLDANQTARRRRFELFPGLETIPTGSTDVLPTDWKIRKFDVCRRREHRDRIDWKTTTIGWPNSVMHIPSPESRRMSRNRISSRNADRQRETR